MKRWWIIFLVVVVAAVGVWQVRAARRKDETATQWQTARVRRGTLESTVVASGTVRAKQSAVLVWQVSGVVGTVSAGVGDHVAQDQPLASLREDSWPQALMQARVSLLNAQKQLQDLQDSANLQYAQALQQLAAAQRQRDKAQNHYDWLMDWDKDKAQEEYDKWHNLVNSLQRQINSPTTPPQMKDALRVQLETAKRQEQVAKANLDGPSDLDIQEAEAALALAKAQVEQFQREVDRWKDGPPANEVAILQAQIAAAQATLDMATLKAPFAGVISESDIHVGDLVAPSTVAFRMDALDDLYVDVDLSELDVAAVVVGQPVVLAFDALPGKTYRGEVSAVALSGVTDPAGRNVSFRATVHLLDADEHVRPGMTAAVTIQTARIADALLVPSRAVRVRDGQPVVFLLKGGQPQAVPITLGATSGADVQVLSGAVKEGDKVVLNPPAEQLNFFGGK